MYVPWADLLPDIEVVLVHLPGRDKRIREPLHERLLPLVDELAEALLPHLDKPYAFFGHSMGGLVSFEVARRLRKMNTRQPSHLFISARRPPHKDDPHKNIYRLSDRDFIRLTEYLYGALPDLVRQDPEVLRLFLNIMRADFRMLGTYQYTAEPPLEYPISVYGGLDDKSVNEEVLKGWAEQTTSTFHLKMYPSDHFFIQNSRAAVLQELNRTLSNGAAQKLPQISEGL